jgi:hypothetical protein
VASLKRKIGHATQLDMRCQKLFKAGTEDALGGGLVLSTLGIAVDGTLFLIPDEDERVRVAAADKEQKFRKMIKDSRPYRQRY